ncbi:MAG: two-component sensor histidine kinase [Lysobacteraceae bacterium]|nr:MAG: two-component sensor histidine kinase [Xanthomonadaceae bacterium]
MASAPKARLYRRRLRARIIVSFVLLGTGLTAAFALATLLLRAGIENELVDSWLASEARSFVEFKRAHPEPDAPYQLSRQIEIIARSPRTLANLPYAWQKLDTGVYDMVETGPDGKPRPYKLAVYRGEDIIGFLRYDVSQERLSEKNLLIALLVTLVAFSVLAFLLGLWASRRVMQPVSDLATRLQRFSQGGQPEPLAPQFADDEVGQLAQALDDYAERLTELVRRDREFNADVSHELRTPLAVIRGATELMLAQPDLEPKAAMRLKRIERAVQQCTDLIEALLTLSRGERGHGAASVRRIVGQIVEAHRLSLRGKAVEIVVEDGPEVVVDAPDAVLAVALGNLIGNAVKYTVQGEVRIVIRPDRVEITDSGPGIPAEEAGRVFERGVRGKASEGSKGAGIGLAIVSRLCDLYGWRASLSPRGDGAPGVVARLHFSR